MLSRTTLHRPNTQPPPHAYHFLENRAAQSTHLIADAGNGSTGIKHPESRDSWAKDLRAFPLSQPAKPCLSREKTEHKTKIPRQLVDRFLGLSFHPFSNLLRPYLETTKEKLTYADLAQNLVVTKLNLWDVLIQISEFDLFMYRQGSYRVILAGLELMIFWSQSPSTRILGVKHLASKVFCFPRKVYLPGGSGTSLLSQCPGGRRISVSSRTTRASELVRP